MKSVSTAVENIVSESPFLKELMSLNIVNLSGLARQIKGSVEEETQKKVTEGSVLVALKRLTQKPGWGNQVNPIIFSVAPELTVRSNLCEITVKNSPTLVDKQKKLLAFANEHQRQFVSFTYGVSETTTVVSNQVLDMALKLYKTEQVISIVNDISTLTIKFSSEIVDSPFTYYTILRTLAWSGISIVEMISTFSELVLVLEQADIELAFSLIRKLFVIPSASKEKKRR